MSCEHDGMCSVLPEDGVLHARCTQCGEVLLSEHESGREDVLALVPTAAEHVTRHPEPAPDTIVRRWYVLDEYDDTHLFCLQCRTMVRRNDPQGRS